MQAVILAAGKSTRTYPLTLTKPKPLLRVAGKSIIEHNLDQIYSFVDEIIIIVGYKADMIKDFLGDNYKGVKIKYIVQAEASGNASALKLASDFVSGKFILMFGDDIYSGKDIEKLLSYENAMLVHRVDDPSNFGVIKSEKGIFQEVIEKPKEYISDLVNIGCFVFSQGIFSVLDEIEKSSRGEYELTDAYNIFGLKEKINVVESQDFWFATTYPWNLLKSNNALLEKRENILNKKASVEEGAHIAKNVFVDEGTFIKSGSYIEKNVFIGSNCVIGPNCYIRSGSFIDDDCHIGNGVEIKNSIIGKNTNIAHLSYVGDSVVGEGVNFGAGTIVANLRHDGKNIKSMVNEKLVDSGMKKLGTVVGDGVKTGINCSIYPGVKFSPMVTTLPGEIIKRDKNK